MVKPCFLLQNRSTFQCLLLSFEIDKPVELCVMFHARFGFIYKIFARIPVPDLVLRVSGLRSDHGAKTHHFGVIEMFRKARTSLSKKTLLISFDCLGEKHRPENPNFQPIMFETVFSCHFFQLAGHCGTDGRRFV